METRVEEEIRHFLEEMGRKNFRRGLIKRRKIDRIDQFFLLEKNKNRIAEQTGNLVKEVFMSKVVGNREQEKKEVSKIRSLQQLVLDLTLFQLDLQRHFTKEEWQKFRKMRGERNNSRKERVAEAKEEEKRWEIYIQ